jgi:hypothetical protein
MRRLLLLLALAAPGCTCSDPVASGTDAPVPPTPDAPETSYTECDGSSQAFARQAILAVLGRHPLSQAEVKAYADLYDQIEAMEPQPLDPRQAVAQALVQDPEFRERWKLHFMDALRVHRIEFQSQYSCYGVPDRLVIGPELAAAVRDNPGSSDGSDGGGTFTMLDLLESALVLDDISPVYRAHLYALLSRPLEAANVPPIQAELARRSNFGGIFDDAYLNRDLVCLGCHNSETSVTWNEDPALNRHWPMPGYFERALFGQSSGIDPDRAHAPFRYDGFVVDPFFGSGGRRPWGWNGDCGRFESAIGPDPAGVDGLFGDLTGNRLTVVQLEESLQAGFDSLAAGGLVLGDGAVPDADQAFAWLVSASIVEGVWEEIVGSPLTVANYFPRNEAQRDLLIDLTTKFVASRYSLRTLVTEILLAESFNRLPPEAGCGRAYAMPNVFNPWVIGEDEPALQRNSPADGVFPLSARTLIHAADRALGWTPREYQDFPEDDYCSFLDCPDLQDACAFGVCCQEYQDYCVNGTRPGLSAGAIEQLFLRGLGAFLTNSERGFRGLEFQGRLVWEQRYGACAPPEGAPPDFVAQLVTRATTSGATLGEAVAALKDRLGHAPAIDETEERAALEAVLEASLADPAATAHEAGLRRLCGVLIASPQFVLGGIAAPDGEAIPTLTPSEADYAAICAELARRPLPPLTVTCGEGTLTVAQGP